MAGRASLGAPLPTSTPLIGSVPAAAVAALSVATASASSGAMAVSLTSTSGLLSPTSAAAAAAAAGAVEGEIEIDDDTFTPMDSDFFIDDVKEYICTICHCVVLNPRDLPCGHLSCAHCLEKVTKPPRCPECRADVDLASCPISNVMKKRVARMSVRCRKHREGCREQFVVGDDAVNVIVHRRLCRYETVGCADCKLKLKRGDLSQHRLHDCAERHVECKMCEERMKLAALREHQNNDFGCKSSRLCPNKCGGAKPTVVSNRTEEAHLRVCPLQPIACELCGAPVHRREMEAHDAKESRTHLLAMQARIRTLEDENARLKSSDTPRFLCAPGGYVRTDYVRSSEVFDVALHKWTPGRDLDATVGAAPVVQIGSSVYVLGGWDGKLVLDTIRICEVQRHAWRSSAVRLRAPRWGAAAALLRRVIYVVGGADQKDQALSSVEGYDIDHDRYVAVPPMSTVRCRPAVAAWGGRLFVFGGHDKSNGNKHLNTVEVYDPDRKEWSTIEPMPHTFSTGVACLLGDCILLLGGSVNQTLSDAVWRFNPMTRKWAALSPMPGPRSEMLAVPCGRVVFVFGGYSGGQAGAPSCMAYDADTEEWSLLPPMPTARQF